MTPISRRAVLRLLSVAATAVVLPLHARRLGPALPLDAALFPQAIASGDPTMRSVVLWTRVAPPAWGREVVLQVAEDTGIERLRVERGFVVGAETDGCLKVRVDALEPGRAWYYRFVVDGPAGTVASPSGRTITTPDEDEDRDLRLAVLSCQDYSGRWYNTLLPLLEEPLDAIVHLGDFIYETTGDPSFQSGEGRRVVFDDAAGALSLGDGGFQAACSLDNYRQLHREYRTDPVLQALLAKAPLIAIWDDHEFADDAWQDVATFHDGRQDERDRARRRASEQAWFEYMPVDVGGGFEGAPVPVEALHPETRIWREFRFGRRASLTMTDYRSFRPDHLVPEDAFPGAIVFDEPTLREALPRIGESFNARRDALHPYVDLASPAYRRWRRPLARALRKAYAAEGLETAEVRSRVDAILSAPIALVVANAILQRHDASAPFFLDAGPIPDSPDLPRGLSWAALGKSRLFDAVGSRYFVLADGYELFARLRAAGVGGVLGSAYGAAQEEWLKGAARRHAGVRWPLIGSSVSFTPMRLDLRRPEVQAPPAWAHEVLLNVDQWDAFTVEREAWLDHFNEHGAVLLSGDIHASLASQHRDRVVELTTPAVSSKSLGAILERNASGDAATREAGQRLAAALDPLLRHGYAGMRCVQTRRNGAMVLALGADELVVRFLEIDGERVSECLYEPPESWRSVVQEVRFAVRRGDDGWRLQEAGV